MKILFAHCNGLGQFEYFAPYLMSRGWKVDLITRADAVAPVPAGITVHRYSVPQTQRNGTDTLYYSCQYAAENALGFLTAAQKLLQQGYVPDLVVAHCGWGIGLCVKDVWPTSVYVAYHEWYYTDRNWAANGMQEVKPSATTTVLNRIRNLPIIAEFDSADANWAPNEYQASRFPPDLRNQIQVIPDGVDLEFYRPDAAARIEFPQLSLPKDATILTYATRGAEPTRGFPQFMTMLADLQKRRPEVHAIVVGKDSVAYGEKLPQGDSWHLRMIDKLDLDLRRVHFLTTLPRDEYRRILQASTIHFYFTEPFVLSWSFAEAMAAGCLIIASDARPTVDFIEHGKNGFLTPMNRPGEIVRQVEGILENPSEARRVRKRARSYAEKHFDSREIFMRKEQRLLELARAGGEIRRGVPSPRDAKSGSQSA